MSSASLALDTLRRYWNTTTIPVDPVRIATKMHIKVVADPKLKDSGLYVPENGEGIPEIYYNSSESLLRQRFTVAHEIGHYVMRHGSVPRETSENFTLSSLLPAEREASIFAMHILIPSDAVNAAISLVRLGTVEHLARAFCVSRVAMSFRLKELGYGVR